MARFDTAAPASLFLDGYRTGANTAETRLRRLQQQSQFDIEEQHWQAIQADRLRQQQQAMAQRQATADALHAAIAEQIQRTAGMRPTYGEIPGPFDPAAAGMPAPDETDTQWMRAADRARETANVEGLSVLLKEGVSREKRAENAKKLRYVRQAWDGNPSVLAEGPFRTLFNTMTDADDPTPVIQSHYVAQEAERVRLQRKAEVEADAKRKMLEEQQALEPAYAVLRNPRATPEQHAQALAVLASRNAPVGGRGPVDMATPDEVEAALAGVPEPIQSQLRQVYELTGKMPTPSSMMAAYRGEATAKRQDATSRRQLADRNVVVAEKEYRALSGQKGKAGLLAPPSPKDVKRAKHPAETKWGDGMSDMDEADHAALLARIDAWDRYQAAKAEREAAFGAENETPENTPASSGSNDVTPAQVFGAWADANKTPDAESVKSIAAQLRDMGLSRSDVEFMFRSRGMLK